MLCRWLPADHRFRTDETFGSPNHSGPPEPRNHDECVAQGKASDEYIGFQNAHVKNDTGINRSCPLSFLHLFDIVWDICPDMMHIIKNFFEKLTFKLFAGKRTPQWDNSKNKKPAQGVDGYRDKLKRHKDAKKRWKKAVDQNTKCIFSEADQKLVDQRVKNLVGPARWIKNSMVSEHMCMDVYTYCVHCVVRCVWMCILKDAMISICTLILHMSLNKYTFMRICILIIYMCTDKCTLLSISILSLMCILSEGTVLYFNFCFYASIVPVRYHSRPSQGHGSRKQRIGSRSSERACHTSWGTRALSNHGKLTKR